MSGRERQGTTEDRGGQKEKETGVDRRRKRQGMTEDRGGQRERQMMGWTEGGRETREDRGWGGQKGKQDKGRQGKIKDRGIQSLGETENRKHGTKEKRGQGWAEGERDKG